MPFSLLLRTSRLLAASVSAAALCACAGGKAPADLLRERALALSVSDLQMHLSDDTYQSYAHLDDHGRNAFDVALWRLEQLRKPGAGAAPEATDNLSLSPIGAQGPGSSQSLAPGSPLGARLAAAPVYGRLSTELWTDEDLVIEFARARALGRLRRYEDAANAFVRVETEKRLLAKAARDHREIMQVFSSLAEATTSSVQAAEPAGQLPAIRAWIRAWNGLAVALGDSEYASLAQLESEALEQAEVEIYAADGDIDGAIDVCQRLVTHHRLSKLYPRHLIRLGDLYAEVARREHRRAQTTREPLNVSRYEHHLERAFAAYELASEARKPTLRREARAKIESLLAFHEGVRSDVH